MWKMSGKSMDFSKPHTIEFHKSKIWKVFPCYEFEIIF